MKPLLFAALGLTFGALLSSLLTSGCGCPEDQHLAPVPAGTYVPTAADGAEADYQLVISGDFSEAVETFTRAGKAYEIRYSVAKSDI